ncbi:ABC transporter permease [Ancylobacter polymorphus]|uniref:NitT/TauT family transport system permease protein n=1 Tax=Ancylobacter polymorphus TaxID=223390 RepID=A0ABU0BG99_9HYPH|nr:ABC transporter permease subunit [Ancylobacter polymorphus]MDQ0304862.1 NitT/TauT family transport system permease protein [Ancylobacter polymorphus]
MTKDLRNHVLVLVVLLVLWQAVYLFVGDLALRSPLDTARAAFGLVRSEGFGAHLRETATAFATALAIAIVLGVAIGFALGMNRLAGEVGEPLLVSFYSLPKITVYPIVLLIFGIGMPSKVAFGAIHGIMPIAIFTLGALRNVPPVLIRTARVLRLGAWQSAWSVLFPAARPEIFTGLRLGFSLTLIGTLLGEMFASQRGLGFLLMQAIGLHDTDLIMALTSLIVLFAVLASMMLLACDRALRHGS